MINQAPLLAQKANNISQLNCSSCEQKHFAYSQIQHTPACNGSVRLEHARSHALAASTAHAVPAAHPPTTCAHVCRRKKTREKLTAPAVATIATCATPAPDLPASLAFIPTATGADVPTPQQAPKEGSKQ